MDDITDADILPLSLEHNFWTWSAQAQVNPIAVKKAKGVYFWDVDGKRYLDFNSMVMCVNIGHGDERVIEAIVNQARELPFAGPGMATRPRAQLGKLLSEIVPEGLTRFLYTLGGSDANENAIKLARGFTGRHKILARYRAYHGATAGAITLTGDPRRWAAEPSIPGVVRIPDFYPYRAGKDQDDPEYADQILAMTEEIIQFEGPQTIAGMIIESVVGTNGLLIPSERYIRGLRDLCTKYGILLICDEVMSGFGRTGEWFAVDHWGVQPDIITMAKGLTSAYVPLGATMVSQPIADYFEDRPLFAGLTYNSHAVGCAAAVACINVYREDKLIENARALGETLKAELGRLKQRHPSVGDVRAIGLFSIIELVKDRATREPMTPYNPKPSELGPMPAFGAFLRENGLFTFVRWNTCFVNPPLIVSEQQLREGLAIIDRALDITDRAVA